MNRKKVVPSMYFVALVMATLIFVGGILLGNHLSNMKLNNLDTLRNDIRLEALGTELQYLVAEQAPCEYMNQSIYTKHLTDMGERLTFMEQELGQDNPEVLSVKEHYHLLQIQHWAYTRKWLKECGQNKTLVLFFYSNLEECPYCDRQGYLLTYLWEKYANFNVYSFEFSIDNPVLDTLKELYDVRADDLPVVIIDGRKHDGFQDRGVLMNLLGLDNETE